MFYIDSNQKCTAFVKKLLEEQPEYIAIDTEFVRQNTYYPILGLIQIAFEDDLYLIDPLQCDIHILKPLLENEYIVKVFHSCRQDIEILQDNYHIHPKNIMDLQVLSTLLKLGNQISLDQLTKQFLNFSLDKNWQFCDWLKRPLTEEQQIYAQDDVRSICKLYPLLKKHSLFSAALLQWHDVYIFRMLSTLNDHPENRILKQFCLAARQQDVFKLRFQATLHIWRERIAKKYNKARQTILTNKIIDDIAFALTQKKLNLKDILFKDKKKYPRFLTKDLRDELQQFVNTLEAGENLCKLEFLTEHQKQQITDIKKKLQNKAEQIDIPFPFIYDKTELCMILMNQISIESLPYCQQIIYKEVLL